MDRFLAPDTPEALAYTHLTETWFSWESEDLSTLIARAASYQAFVRYLSGADLFIVPRTRHELESILRRHAYDAIHNTIARARSTLERGGYSRACYLAEKSIRGVLNTKDNAVVLLSLHRPDEPHQLEMECPTTRPITTQ